MKPYELHCKDDFIVKSAPQLNINSMGCHLATPVVNKCARNCYSASVIVNKRATNNVEPRLLAGINYDFQKVTKTNFLSQKFLTKKFVSLLGLKENKRS